jgi:glycosyltransferase involved in cell wall biosynthesis
MRILIALTYYRPHYSGLTIHAEREARALVRRGHQVRVLTSQFDRDLPEFEIKDGVEIQRMPVAVHISKGVIMPSMPIVARRLAAQCDVIHLHAPQLDAALIATLGRWMNKPVVLTYHCDLQLPKGFVHRMANGASNLANHISARQAQVIVHNTYDYAEHSPFLKHYLDKVFPIYPPVEVAAIGEADRQAFRQKFQLQPGERVIGMAARLATEKGVEYLAEALPTIMNEFPQARVLFVGPHQKVVGEEAYAQRLEPLLASLGDHWSFLGILTPAEMTAFFQECEVTILPSINSTESYGLVQVESMMCGTPVVSSDLPGVRVPVQETGMGLVVEKADPVAIAKAVIQIFRNPTGYRGLPEGLIRLSGPDSVAEAYENAFELAQEKLYQRQVETA